MIHPISKTWDIQALKSVVTPAEVEAISAVPISVCNREDQLMWHLDSKGQFCVKSGYRVAIGNHHAQLLATPTTSFRVPENVWKNIWHLPLPPKLRHFWWRVCNNLLASKHNLWLRKCSGDGVCPICHRDPETVEHLFVMLKFVESSIF